MALKRQPKEEPYFKTKKANQKRYEEIRAEVEAIKARIDRKGDRFTTDEELFALINKEGKKKKRGHRDAAYARKLAKKKAKKK